MLFIPHRSVARISSCLFSTIFQSTAREPNPLIFFLSVPCFVAPSPPEGMHFPPPEKQTSTRSAGVGGGKHIPGCSSSLKPQMPPTPAVCPARPASRASAQHPSLPTQPGQGPDRIRSRMFNLISFPFWFQEAKQGESNGLPWSRAACPCAHGEDGGLCTSPTLQVPFTDKVPSGCCSRGLPGGHMCRYIPALREHAKALALSLGTRGWFTAERM